MTLEELTAELTAQKETIQLLLQQLEEERQERQKRVAEAASVGTIAAFGGGTFNNIPRGWLACGGASLNVADHPRLFEAIGTAWGHGDNPPNTFNLPDLRGMFLRGVDGGVGRDKDVSLRSAGKPGGNPQDAVGSFQGDAFAGHSHGINDPGHTHSVNDPGHAHDFDFFNDDGRGNPGGSFPKDGLGSNTRSSRTGISIQNSRTAISVQPAGVNETRPKNAYVIWIIKSDPK